MQGGDEVGAVLETAALALAFVLLGRRRLPACIAALAAQAGVVAATLAWRAWGTGAVALALAAVLVLLLQGVALTLALRHVVAGSRLAAPVDAMPGRLALGVAVAGLALALAPALPALAVALVGALGLVVRGGAVAQTIGLAAMGNGMLLAAASVPALAPVSALAVPVPPALVLLGIWRFAPRDGRDATVP